MSLLQSGKLTFRFFPSIAYSGNLINKVKHRIAKYMNFLLFLNHRLLLYFGHSLYLWLLMVISSHLNVNDINLNVL